MQIKLLFCFCEIKNKFPIERYAENYNDKHKMTHNSMSTDVDINIEVYLFQEYHCVLSL